MSTHRSSIRESAEYWCNTQMKVHEVKYVWTIDNFDFHEAEGSELNSPAFSTGDDQVKWYLNLGPNGEHDEKKTISLYVCLSSESTVDDKTKKVYAKYSIGVSNGKQNEITEIDADDNINEFEFRTDDEEAHGWGKSIFLYKSSEIAKEVLSNNKFTITCTIIYSLVRDALTNDVHKYTVAPIYRNVLENDFVENFGILLENHEFADVILCVKEKEFPAHKLILAMRSSVFAAMFKHKLKENETNRIEIEDMNEEVVAEMLRCIYIGECENAEKLVDGLLAAADKYDLNRLKMICAETLHKTLSVDNALNILALADLHGVQELKSEVLKFIVIRFSEIVMSTAWKNMLVSNPNLIDEACKAVAGQSPASIKRKYQAACPTKKRKRSE